MKTTGPRGLVLLALLLLIPACGVGGGGGTLTPTVAPGSPGQVKAVAGNGRVTLTWTSAGAGEEIIVSRSITAGGPYLPVSVPSGFVAPDTYVDAGLDNDTRYYYVVSAKNPFGESAPSFEVEGEPNFKPVLMYAGSGSSNTLSLFEDGTVWGCGNNGAGQLATGDFSPASAPVQMNAPAGTVALGAGWNFSVFLLKDGTVWGAGATWEGALGPLPPNPPMLAPVHIPGVSNIKSISTGGSHVLALDGDGTVWAWGNNTAGQIGTGLTGGIVSTPYPIPSLSGVVAVSAGYYFSLALLDNGTVWAWGQNVHGNCATGEVTNVNPLPTQVLNLNGVVRISGGGNHALALRNDGTVWGWGDAGMGQVGHGVATSVAVTIPVPVSTLTGVVAVSAGRHISLALRSDGSVWSWGTNESSGMLGNGAVSGIVPAPARITALSDVKAVAAGGFHAVALKSDGSLFSWGSNASGELGIGSTDLSLTPVVVNNFTSAVAIAAGKLHSHAVRPGGAIWAWGGNQDGTMANGTTGAATTALPAASSFFTNATVTAAGERHGIAIQNGSLYTWGSNQHGQIGNNVVSLAGVATPHTVNLAGSFTGVDAGWSHTLALRSDGLVFAWGINTTGQIGNGGTSPFVASPSAVTVLDKAVAVSGGGFHNLALRTDPTVPVVGAVWSWGSNSAGQLGKGVIAGPVGSTPSAIPGLVDMTAVAAGGFHRLALKNDGTVWAWGSNGVGQLGDGTTIFGVPTAFQVPGLSGVVAIAAGESHSLALLGDGTVWAWGKNDVGQLGDGTNTMRPSPVQVQGLTGILKITCGNTHNLALDGNGLLWAWGSNTSEQLGKTLVKFSSLPVAVAR